jgi:hypothetical protein
MGMLWVKLLFSWGFLSPRFDLRNRFKSTCSAHCRNDCAKAVLVIV